LAGYLRCLPEEVAASPGYRVLPGVESLLPRLVEAGVLLGITSGGLEAGAHAKLARAGLNRFFSFGGYGSDSNERIELTRRAIGKLYGGVAEARSESPPPGVSSNPRCPSAAPSVGCRSSGWRPPVWWPATGWPMFSPSPPRRSGRGS